MIFFDTTKSGPARHRSGLNRVSTRLRDELGPRATAVAWDAARRDFARPGTHPLRQTDWFLTAELFSEEERPGWTEFLDRRRCRLAAIFHDAIPLKHPHITWPQSVARHPGYLKLLARFDRIWAVSRASRDELLGYWRWIGLENPPPVGVLALGADAHREPRNTAPAPAVTPPRLLCLGIVEPRKNQLFLLEVCEALWREGLVFELHVVGRVNPRYGAPIVARLDALRRTRGAALRFHDAAPDAVVADLFATARATALPTLAEGCGLPLLESLWRGVPCVCSDLPVLRENTAGGGCLPVPLGDAAAWRAALRQLLTDDALHDRLCHEAVTRPLPTWAEAARTLAGTLTSSSPA